MKAVLSVPTPQQLCLPGLPEFPSQIVNIGVSTSALFDTREDDLVFREKGEEAYRRHMRAKEKTPFAPGPALSFLKKMIGFNKPDGILANFTILSRNNPQVSIRVHRSLYEHGLFMKTPKGRLRFGMGEAYMKGRPITPNCLRNFGVDLFLSPNRADVENALRAGIPAGQTFHYTIPKLPSFSTPDLLVAFDFDRVLGFGRGKPRDPFKDDSEEYFRREGLLSYWTREAKLVSFPAHPGPLATFFCKLVQLRKRTKELGCKNKLEIATVTARSSDPFARVQTTIDHWGGPFMEEDFRLSSRRTPKRNHLEELQADVFFDDSEKHVANARDVTAAVLVPDVNQRRPQLRPLAPRLG